jgi:hypothetical protein
MVGHERTFESAPYLRIVTEVAAHEHYLNLWFCGETPWFRSVLRRQPVMVCERGRFCAIACACFGEDVAEVMGNSIEADEQLVGNLLIGLAGRQ